MAMTSPFRAELDAAVGAVGMQVTRDTVLQARAVLLAEADRLDEPDELGRRDRAHDQGLRWKTAKSDRNPPQSRS